MAERTSSGPLMEPPPAAAAVALPAAAVTLPAEVRERLAELELELSEGNHRPCIEQLTVSPTRAVSAYYSTWLITILYHCEWITSRPAHDSEGFWGSFYASFRIIAAQSPKVQTLGYTRLL
jgi:hypothetical protein